MSIFSKLISSIGEGKAHANLPAEACLIDVRSPEEYASGHIEGAINIPLDRFYESIARVIPDRNTPVILCCRSGMRSSQAHIILRELKYEQAHNGGSVGALALQLRKEIRRGG